MATTPVEWLPILTKRLDDRAPRIARLRSYSDGNAPLPEMGKNVRASWVAFQAKARTNLGGLAIGSLADRCVPNGVRIGTDGESPAVDQARRIWRDNRLDVQFADAINDALAVSVGYLAVGIGADGEAVVTREAPEQFIAAPDPLRPWKARATLKVWRDVDAETDYAQVVVRGAWQRFARPSREPDHEGRHTQQWRLGVIGNDWTPITEPMPFDGDPTVAILDRKDGKGLIEPHLDVIDRINLGKLNRLVITAMQAFRQRATKGELPEKDESGNAIDYSKVFEPAPGALWDLPEGIDIWESEQTDIRPMLEGEKADARDFAAVSRTPISVFIPEGANQSAEGAAAAKEGQIQQAHSEIKRLSPALAVAIVYALRAEGADLGEDTVEVLWTPPEHVSMTEKYAAAVQAKAAGASWKSIARDILGYSPDQIAQDELDRAEEQLAAVTLIAATQPAPPAAQPQAPQARVETTGG